MPQKVGNYDHIGVTKEWPEEVEQLFEPCKQAQQKDKYFAEIKAKPLE